MVKVAVIGAGVNGLSCAVRIKEKYPNYQVTLISSEFSPNTTGDGSGGLWYPYLYGTTPLRLIQKWSGETFEYLRELWKSGDVKICLQPIYEMFMHKENFMRPDWLSVVHGYQELNPKQLKCMSDRYSSNYVAGQTFITFVIPPPRLLAYFMKRFEEAGGDIRQAKITSLKDPILEDFDVIINCTGLGSRFIVSDEKVVPIRGQIVKVQAPWVLQTVIDDTGRYIIPNVDGCVLGGTHQDSFDTNVDPKDTDYIMDNCKKMIPGLKHAMVMTHWTGLRPGREEIRLESEAVDGKLYIHNYGHGGSGFTLFWGCSGEVLELLEMNLNNKTPKFTSKL